jgi:hypothetical protein
MHEHLSSLQLPPSPRPQGLGLELDIEMVTVGGAIEDSSRTQVRRRRTPLPRTQFSKSTSYALGSLLTLHSRTLVVAPAGTDIRNGDIPFHCAGKLFATQRYKHVYSRSLARARGDRERSRDNECRILCWTNSERALVEQERY